jgi:S-adenosyl-L-methionine hydrolase (adenosine-forming)
MGVDRCSFVVQTVRPNMKTITLTTDFGLADWFVGTMKGVILRTAPNAPVVDLTHGIAPGDIRAGAFALAAAYRYFPAGTIHVAVVDPGVGSERAGVVIETENYHFVGPDNGVFSFALRGERLRSVHRLENPKFQLTEVSRTFHGRDIFAPAAAHLSRGVPAGQFGPRVHDLVQLAWPEPVATSSGLRGEVVHLDHFGNAITNLPASRVLASGATRVTVGGKSVPLRECYADVPRGKPVAVIGSSGLLEVAVSGGNAAKSLKLKCGSRVSLNSFAKQGGT